MKKTRQLFLIGAVMSMVFLAGMALDASAAKKSKIDGKAMYKANCKICHDTFPQQTGAIDELKKSGDLKPKQVMNKLCTKCHRDRKQAGETSGPTTCTKCHQKG